MARPRIDDIKAACNIIKLGRKNARRRKHKTLTVPLTIDDINLGLRIDINYNPSTECSSISPYGINYKGITIYPTTHEKLKCTNQHALDTLEKARKSARDFFRKKKM